MDTKTPVTLLQELLLKKGETPDYVLLHNGVGTHDPLFVYEVTGLGKTAVGRGKSKREAKHAAAQELLYMINDTERKLESVVQSPYADVLKENAIGALQDFCSIHMISVPNYEQIRDEGLPHAKLFGVKCTVSTLSTQAEARTKKQAKQAAAQLMLVKLKECLKEMGDTCEKKAHIMEENDKKAMRKLNEYYEKEELRIPQTRPLGTPLDHYDHLFKQDLFISSEAFNSIKGKNASYFDELENPEILFSEIMVQLDLQWDKAGIPVIDKCPDSLFCIEVKALNNATFFGMGPDEASALRGAFTSALKWFSVMGL